MAAFLGSIAATSASSPQQQLQRCISVGLVAPPLPPPPHRSHSPFPTPQLSRSFRHSCPPSRRSLGIHIRCRSDTNPGANESKAILEAFFIGKAFAEAVTDRIGSAFGELLSDIGRWQAEQQKQARDFQEEVQERAKSAKMKAARQVLSDEETREKQPPSYNGAPTASTSVKPSAAVQPRVSNPPFQEPRDL